MSAAPALSVAFREADGGSAEKPGAGFVTSLLETIDAGGRVTAEACKGVCFQRELLARYLLFYNRVGGHGQVMFRRETLLKIGGYNESAPASQDRELWPRLLREGPCVVVPEVLFQWRSANPSSITKNLKFRCAECSIAAGQRRLGSTTDGLRFCWRGSTHQSARDEGRRAGPPKAASSRRTP